MEEKIIDGKLLANQILENITNQIKQLIQVKKRLPCLAVVLVGDNPASQVYVKNKKSACHKVGIVSQEYLLPASINQQELNNLIIELNHNNEVDGILVQLPLPEHLDSSMIIDIIVPNKDVDGFHRYNIGSLAINQPNISPCTPHGVMYILDNLKTNYHGKHAIILGSSNIVGRPMAFELMNRGATVTVCNSKTRDLPAMIANADILIAAIGRAKFVKADWLKSDSIIIDVGINRTEDGKLCGDVDYQSALNKVRYITPVPGGVGPMTIAMLLKNTMRCYLLNESKK